VEKLFEYLAKEWNVVSQAPFAFVILASITFGLAYLASRWRFTGVIEQVKSQNETLKERLHLKTEQAESYKDRALKYDEKALAVVDSTEITLKEKSLDFVKNLREFIERYKREDQAVHDNEWNEMASSKSEEEKSKLWQKFTSASSRLSTERNAEYDRRFKVDALLLRDELRSRLKDYQPSERHHDSAYEHPTNYFGFNDVANDIEKMAKLLATANK
jgi:hypothetical protein